MLRTLQKRRWDTANLGGGGAAIPWYLSGNIPTANCIAAYQPKGAASYTASKTNLITPGTYDAFEGSTVSWSSAGWQGDRDKYLKTGITVAEDTWSMVIRYTRVNDSPMYGCIAGGRTTGNTIFEIWPNNGTGNDVRYSNGQESYVATITYGDMVMAVCDRTAFLNGVSQGSIGAWGAGNRPTIYLMGYCHNGSVNYQTISLVAAVAIYNIDVSSSIVALTAAMAAL